MYKTKKSLLGKIMSCVLAVAMLMSVLAIGSFAANAADLEKGSYTVDADMSLYVNAMGGIDFANTFTNAMGSSGTAGIFDSATVTVDENGNKNVTLNFGKGAGVIYTIPFTSYVDASYSLKYYDASHELKDITKCTTEAGTIVKQGETEPTNITYVTSVTFPLEVDTAATVFDKNSGSAVSAGNTADGSTVVVDLWMVVNSNVMGLQFCDGSGTAGSNTFDTETKYVACVSLDLASAKKIVEPDNSKNQSANVEYTVEGGYEVEIPATITVDSTSKEGTYTVEAKNFVIGKDAYVTVTASESGKLSIGSDELAFTNTLADGKLTKTGDTLAGTVKVTDSASNPGKYTGTIDFTINYYAGK